MKDNKKNIDELTSVRIKNLGLDEPSDEFIQNVMQSILKADQPAYARRPVKYYWLLGLIPVVIIISWYLLVLFHMTGFVEGVWIAVTHAVESFLSKFLSFFIQMKSINLQPTILIGFFTVLSLLVIEEFAVRVRRLL
jgi:hypothetical protein